MVNSNFYHNILASYFTKKLFYLDGTNQKEPNIRKLVEQPWQQTKGEMWDEVTYTLCNLDFIQAKAAAKMTYELVNDFNAALEVIPDNAQIVREEEKRLARMTKYTMDLISFAKGEIKELEVPESITPWRKDRIEKEIERIRNNPDKADKLKDFLHFVGSKAGIFQKYASESKGLTYQEAWHFANDGPVGKSAGNISPEIRKSLLLRDLNSRPPWNPLPQALKIILNVNKGSSEGLCSVDSVAITPDGKQAISGSWDECNHWDLSTGKPIQLLTGTLSNSAILNFSGKWVFPKSEGHTSTISGLSLTPDGKLAFSGSWDNTCILWDLTNGKVLKTLKGHSGHINVVSITPDGSWAISGSDDKTCILWDLQTGGKPKILEGHLFRINAVSITPDGKRAISASPDRENNCILWNLENGEKLRTFGTDSNFINKLYITHDGNRAICLGFRCLIWIDLTTGEVLQTITGFSNYFGQDISFTPDGRRALSVSKDNTIILWDLTTGKELLTLRGHKSYVNAVAITADGKFGISGSSDKTCILWDLEKGITLPGNNDQNLHLKTISTTPDGEMAFIGSNDSQNNATATLLNLKNGRVQHAISENAELVSRIPGIKLSNNMVSAVSITSNGQRGISGSMNMMSNGTGDSVLKIYDLLKGTVVKALPGHTSGISDVCITEEGRCAISSSEDKSCILWDLVTGEKLKTFKGHEFNVNKIYKGHGDVVDKICFVPDGKLVLFSTSGAGCKVWNLETGESLPNIIPPLGKAFAITPDGKLVLSIAKDMSCIVWNLKTGKVFQILKGHSSSINTVSVSPDSKLVISGSSNGSCLIWDLVNGKLLSGYFSNSGFLSVRFMPLGIFLCGDYGEMVTLQVDRNLFCPVIAITTIKHTWDFILNRFTAPLVYCPLCGHRFEPPVSVLDTIEKIKKTAGLRPDQSPCLELPDEAWDDPGLLGYCPKCGEKLKFNPFIAGGLKFLLPEFLQ